MKLRLVLASSLLLLQSLPAGDAQELPENKFPAEVEQALNAPEKAVLYSVEPDVVVTFKDEKIYGRKLLGKTDLNPQQTATAVAVFRAAVAASDGARAMCFNPRHALRLTFQKHDYLFLLCFQCGQLQVYKDDKTLVADLAVAGDSDVLNRLLTDAKVPLAYAETKEGQEALQRAYEEQQKKDKDARQRWLAAMPQSIRPLWNFASSDAPSLHEAISREFPDPVQRSVALLGWFGSGSGLWSGYYGWEQSAEDLLLEIPTPDLIKAAEQDNLTEAQIEGAARLFAGWDFSQKRPQDLKMLSPALKKKLLDHSLKNADDDKRGRAKHAFGK